MAVNKNKAWNLMQGDGRQYAASSFTVERDSHAKIHAHYLSADDKIVVLEIDDAAECTDADNPATVHCMIDCDSPILKIKEEGRYIVARQCGRLEGDIYSMNAYVTVRKYNK